MAAKKGFITYSSSGFEQDSGLAMKNDVIRGLVELITNADDAYARGKKSGTIEIVVHRSSKKGDPVTIVVRDRATGLDPQGMENNFTVLGGDKSGFATGEDVRGLFNRGSKDTAWFGSSLFETVKDGVYTRVHLDRSGNWESDSVMADDELHARVGLSAGEAGLSATMFITRQDTRVPELRDLVERLASHVQLRQVTLTQTVTITEFRDGKLTQSRPIVWEVPTSTQVFEGDIDIPGYDCTAHLVVNRLDERSDGPVTEYSAHGIEVRGGRAAYMNTMFGQNSQATALVHGVLTCQMIDDLIRDFGNSDGADPKNPMRMVSRSRDGLEDTHPFMKALSIAVLEKLKPILADLEPKPAEAGSQELRKDLDTFARLLAEEMKADLDDDDDSGIGGKLPTAMNPIIVIPPIARVRIGSKCTLTVLVHEGSAGADGLQVAVSSPVCTVNGKPTAMKHHATFAETLVCQVRLDGVSLGSASVVVSAKSKPSDAGTAEVVVHNSDKDEKEPTTLEWKSSPMSVTTGKTRTVRLRAPLSLAPTGELVAMVTLESDNIRLEDDVVTLKLTTKGWLEARVHVTGVSHSKKSSTIVAKAAGKTAEGSIRTTVPSPLDGLNIVPELVDQFAGPLRGEIVVEDSVLKLVMYGRHRGLAARLGSLRKDGSYERDTELDTLAVIAEVMASVASEHVLKIIVNRNPSFYQDLDKILYEHTKLVDRYLRILLEGIRVPA